MLVGLKVLINANSTSRERNIMRIEQYREAFQRCYPQVKLGLRIKRIFGKPHLMVAINGNEDNRPLSEEEVNSAILDFKRGSSRLG